VQHNAAVANGSRFGGPAHAKLLAELTGDEQFAQTILSDYTRAGLPVNERTLLDYVWKLSKAPGEMTEADIEGVRAAGWTDPQIVAMIHVTSLFAYMNRIAEAFGLTEA
jgi:uncharacterized peroxidase-related enzyme